MTKPKICIIGIGMVGGAVYKYYPEAIVYSPNKYPDNKDKVSQADIIFICVPTPFLKDDKGFDLSAVEESFRIIEGEKIIILKSTVWPGTTEKLQAEYPQHKVLFNPEFLREKSAAGDFARPNRQIIGITNRSKSIAKEIISLLPPAPYQKIVTATEAELIKYYGNCFLATKVVFAELMYDFCQKLGIDYEIVKEVTAADPRIGPSHMNAFFEGYRGYGGSCFPKDMRSLIQFGEKIGVDVSLLKKIESKNNEYRGGVFDK